MLKLPYNWQPRFTFVHIFLESHRLITTYKERYRSIALQQKRFISRRNATASQTHCYILYFFYSYVFVRIVRERRNSVRHVVMYRDRARVAIVYSKLRIPNLREFWVRCLEKRIASYSKIPMPAQTTST